MEDIKPKIKLWFANEAENGFFGEGKCRLLMQIKKKGSLSAAAEELNISYRKAWGDLKKAENGLGVKLIDKVRGGKGGGNTELTPEGEMLLKIYSDFKIEVKRFVNEKYEEKVIRELSKLKFFKGV